MSRKFQVSVIVLLCLIWVELGGLETIARLGSNGSRWISKIATGAKEEGPAPGIGGPDFDNTEAIQRMADQPPKK